MRLIDNLLAFTHKLGSLPRLLAGPLTSPRRRRLPIALAAAALLIGAPASSHGAGINALQAKVSDARSEAQSLVSELQASKTQLFAAQQRAAAAAAREERLSGMLVEGRRRAAALAERVRAARLRLERERARLGRARAALASRLVAIYETGEPDAASIALASQGIEDLVARSGYITAIQSADNALTERVEEVRDAVRHTVRATTELRDRARAYDARLAGAREKIAAARADAEAQAANLAALSAARASQVATLQTRIDSWVKDIEAARAAAARRAEQAAEAQAAAAAAAQQEVDRWLGGPYSIPAYIVLCESGGNYSAVNPSSGAGGAYQILPSTWALYGGTGAPQDASKAEQDRIAAEIYADSGTSAWVCG